jgi:hypothetical protein
MHPSLSISTHIHPPIYSASTLEVRVHIYSIQIHPENSSTLILGVNCQKIKFPSSIASPFCYSIKLQTSSYATSCIMFQKRLGYSIKKKKEDKCPTQNKERFSSPSSSQNLQVSKGGIWNFSKEISIHHRHSFTPYNHFYSILYLSIYHHLPYSLYTCISWFDFMTRFFGSIVLIMQYMFCCLPTYELHISLLEVGWERKGIHHNCLGEDPEIPQRRDLEGSYIGISEFYFENLAKL